MTRFFQFSLLVTLFLGCSGSNKNMESTKEMFDAFNRHDWNRMASYYAPEAQFLDPSYGLEYVTKTQAQTSSKYAEMETLFPDIKDDIKAMYSDGEKVIVEFVSTGSSGDSISLKLPIVSVLTFKDGKIVRDATYYDQ